jgi:cytochrome c oxidase subunit 3
VNDVLVTKEEEGIPNSKVNNQGMAGLFFSIYYCMTGVHAVHIIGGMVVITWLIVKASREEFHSQYFGPVDNVGLYWHLVDFIWIYLFPLLYLIT